MFNEKCNAWSPDFYCQGMDNITVREDKNIDVLDDYVEKW
jgi:hypothetical protein